MHFYWVTVYKCDYIFLTWLKGRTKVIFGTLNGETSIVSGTESSKMASTFAKMVNLFLVKKLKVLCSSGHTILFKFH